MEWLPTEPVESPPLEIFILDCTRPWASWSNFALLWAGIRPRRLPEVPFNWNYLWSYERVRAAWKL